MVSIIFNRTTKNGRKVMIMFAYADGNGEPYTRFVDASYQNFDRGATYAAFVASARPNTIPCWEMDEEFGFMDRALTVAEKEAFQKKVLAGYEA